MTEDFLAAFRTAFRTDFFDAAFFFDFFAAFFAAFFATRFTLFFFLGFAFAFGLALAAAFFAAGLAAGFAAAGRGVGAGIEGAGLGGIAAGGGGGGGGGGAGGVDDGIGSIQPDPDQPISDSSNAAIRFLRLRGCGRPRRRGGAHGASIRWLIYLAQLSSFCKAEKFPMRALALLGHGGIGSLAEVELPSPELSGDDEVLIRIRAAAINHLDLFLSEGIKGISVSFPHIVGTDGAGVVERVGALVTTVRPGDRVALNPGISCGRCEACLRGEEPLCREYAILGEHRPGTAAELVVVPERNVAKLPENMPWDVAAAFPLSTLTAWRMLTTRAELEPGETVLIWGIGGGVALAALSIARHLGARVFATSSSNSKLERALTLGANEIFNHAETPPDEIARQVRKLTGNGVDVVVDTVGEQTWSASLKSLRPGGRLVTCGATSGPEVALDIRRLFWFQWSILGSTMGSQAEFAEVMALAREGKLWPVVDSVVPLSLGAVAYERMRRGEQQGKLVLEVSR